MWAKVSTRRRLKLCSIQNEAGECSLASWKLFDFSLKIVDAGFSEAAPCHNGSRRLGK